MDLEIRSGCINLTFAEDTGLTKCTFLEGTQEDERLIVVYVNELGSRY